MQADGEGKPRQRGHAQERERSVLVSVRSEEERGCGQHGRTLVRVSWRLRGPTVDVQ
jgi:hypothetical protein